MTYIPPNPSGSGWVGGDQANKMRAQSIAQQVTGTQGSRRRIFTGGTILSPVPQPIQRRFSTLRTLFVTDASTSAPAAKISVTFGQVNGETPTIGGNPISDVPAPTLTVVTGAVYLHAVVDTDGVITALTIENAATMPDNTDNDGYFTLALVTVTANAVTLIQHAAWNVIQMQVCGSVADEGDVTVFLWGGFGE